MDLRIYIPWLAPTEPVCIVAVVAVVAGIVVVANVAVAVVVASVVAGAIASSNCYSVCITTETLLMPTKLVSPAIIVYSYTHLRYIQFKPIQYNQPLKLVVLTLFVFRISIEFQQHLQ